MTARPSLALLAASALVASASAQNDECNQATVIGLGSTAFDTATATASLPVWPCAMNGGPDLWYEFTAPNDARYTFDTCGANYDTALELFTGSCASLTSVECNDDRCALQSSITVELMTGDTVVVRVGGFGGATGAGTLDVMETIVPGPTGSVQAWLTAVGAGTSALYLNSDVRTPIEVDIGSPTGANGVTYEFIVYGDNRGVSSALMGNLGGGTGNSAALKYEQFSDTMQYGITEFGVTDFVYTGAQNSPGVDTHLVFVADLSADTTELYVNGVSIGSAALGILLQGVQGIGQVFRPGDDNIDVLELGAIYGVAVYDAALSVAEIQAHRDAYFSGTLGMRYCEPAVVGSSGASAVISATGSTIATANDLTLNCAGMPNATFGFFLTSMTQAMVNQPGGSLGVLCLGGAIGRYVGPGQVQNSGQVGEISLALDLTLHPTPTGFVTVTSGETWNFQTWFRDSSMGQATSNFSDAVSILFQ